MGRFALALTLAAMLILGVAACGGETADESATTPAASSPAVTPTETSSVIGPGTDQGAEVFANNCAGCHSADGSGDTGPDIRGEDDLARVTSQVESGGDNMPAFAGQLTPAEIEAVSQYVVSELQ